MRKCQLSGSGGCRLDGFISMAQLISEDMKAIGVTMVIEQEPWNSYISSLMGGTYDTAICWGTGVVQRLNNITALSLRSLAAKTAAKLNLTSPA